MIDVTFLLLVYFVTTAAFAQGEGVLTAKFPHDGDGVERTVEPPRRPIKIALTPLGAGGYRLSVADGRHAPRSFSELGDLLEQWRGGLYPQDHPIVIKPHHGVRWTHVVNAFNAAVRAGYDNVTFAKVED